MRLSGTKTSSVNQYNGLGDQLYDLGGARPTLDLNFSSNESLVDSVTGKTLVDHTRQSSATYVDGDGVIRTAVTNINLYSTMNTDYVSTNTNGVYETDQTTAPDGTLTGNKFTEASTTSGRYVRGNYSQNTFTSGKFYLLSVYLKEGANTNKRYAGLIFPSSAFTATRGVTFNLTGNGTAIPNSISGEEPAVYGIESVGNGWYRCWMGETATATSTLREQYRITNDSNNAGAAYAGDGSSHIFMWGTQLEEFNSQQSTPGQYVKTTTAINSAPRFDHDPETGESLGLLVEESRTNLMPYSVATKADWVTSGGTSTDLSLNALGVFPGVRTASGGFTYHGLNTQNITGLTNGETYTATFWFRAGDTNPSNKIRLIFRNDTESSVSDVSKTNAETEYGSVSSYRTFEGAAGTATSSLTVLSAETMADGLTYKLVASFVAEGANTDAYKFGIQSNSETTGETVIALGMQLERGSFATSYIPTSGSTVTRAADVASITGTNFSSWYNDSEGTVFSSSRHKSVTARTLAFTDGTSNNAMQQYLLANTAAMDSYVSNSWQGSGATTITFVADQQFNVASTIQTDSGVTAANGALGTVDTSYGIPTVDRLLIGQSRSSDNTNGTIRRLTYWPTRLSNDTLQTITT